jgi:hypothetical protein
MYSFNKNNDTITEKIKLRNKYASKIIKKFNKSIDLLSEINNHIYKKQKGGGGPGSSHDPLGDDKDMDMDMDSVPIVHPTVDILTTLDSLRMLTQNTQQFSQSVTEASDGLSSLGKSIDIIIQDRENYISELNREAEKMKITTRDEIKNKDDQISELVKQITAGPDELLLKTQMNELSEGINQLKIEKATQEEVLNNFNRSLSELQLQFKKIPLLYTLDKDEKPDKQPEDENDENDETDDGEDEKPRQPPQQSSQLELLSSRKSQIPH